MCFGETDLTSVMQEEELISSANVDQASAVSQVPGL